MTSGVLNFSKDGVSTLLLDCVEQGGGICVVWKQVRGKSDEALDIHCGLRLREDSPVLGD